MTEPTACTGTGRRALGTWLWVWMTWGCWSHAGGAQQVWGLRLFVYKLSHVTDAAGPRVSLWTARSRCLKVAGPSRRLVPQGAARPGCSPSMFVAHPSMRVLSSSVMSDSVTPWAVPHQALLSVELSRQEYWSGLPFPPPGDLPNSGIEPRSLALQANSLPSEPPGKSMNTGVGSLSLLWGIFLTQELNRGLLLCRWILYQLSYQGNLEVPYTFP